MFGQPNTPFGGGGGGFGQPSTNTAPAFGSPAPAPGGLFGTPAQGGFGAPAAPGGFGAPAPAGPFGQPAPAAPFGSSFGSPAPAPGGALFGQPAPAPGFGSTFGAPAPAVGGGLFGQPPAQAPGMFGQPAPAPSSAFGQPPAPGGSLFGAPSTTSSPFGAPAASTFGAPQPAPAFGFGAPAPAFGAPAPVGGGGLFGQPPTPAAPAPVFGASSTPAGGGLFGQPAPAPTGFGGSTFGAPAPAGGGLFGAPAPGGFGAPTPSTPFGATAGAQPGQEGTRAAPFQVTTKKDNNTTINLYSITAMPQYENKSFEELRFEDYAQGNKGSASTPTTSNAPGGFSFAGQAPAGGLFGAQPAPAPFGAPAPAPFGAPAPTAFGAPPAPSAFGAPAPTGGLFGAKAPAPFGTPAPGGLFGAPAPAPFGAPAPTGGLFGSAAPAPFGAPAPAPFGAPAPAPFGAPAPSTGLFGAAPAPFGAPAPAGGGLFGNPAPAPFGAPPSGGLFGQPAPAPFGAPAPGGLFGQPAPSAFSFGAKPPSTGLFGAPSPAPFGGFGSTAPAPFGAPAPTSLFGAPPPAPFGAQPPQLQTGPIPQNAIIIPPTADEANVQGIRALLRSKEEMEKSEIWKGDNGAKSKVSTPTSVSESESIDPLTSSKEGKFFRSSPSLIKIRPKGFPKTETPNKTTSLLSGIGRGGGLGGGIMLPDSKFRSPSVQLVVDKGSLRKPNLRSMPSPRIQESPSVNHPEETLTDVPSPDPSPATNQANGSSNPLDRNSTEAQDKQASRSVEVVPTNMAPEGEPSPRLEAYYQNTINSPQEPIPESTSLRLGSKNAPKLTKDGYEANPPIEELASYSDADLAAVPNFSVSRPGYGKVEWLGAVDIRASDLDRIVVIEPKDVSVYNTEEAEGTKPAEGTRLNRAAYITYYEAFPKDNPEASPEEKQKYMERLEKVTRKMAAEFISYNKTTGEWKIRVRHFSRYALVEEDSDVEDTEYDSSMGADRLPSKPKSILNTNPTPFKKGTVKFDVQLSPEESEITAAKIRESVRASSEKAFAEVFASVHSEDEQPSPTDVVEMEDDESESEHMVESKFVAPSKSTIQSCRGQFSIVSTTLEKRKLSHRAVDGGFHMGRSFRVAWSPDGSLFCPSRCPVAYSITKVCPVFGPIAPPENNETMSEDTLLDVHLRFSEKEMITGEDCPLFCLPSSFSGGGSEKSHNSHLEALREFRGVSGKSIFTLIEYFAGSTRSVESKKTAILKWLVEDCEGDVAKDVASMLSLKSHISAVFAAFSSGDIQQAATLAADSGFHELACVISVASSAGEGLTDMSRIASDSILRNSAMNDLHRLLKNLAGDKRCEDTRHKMATNDLDWRRRLALRLLVSSEDGLDSIIDTFLHDVKKGLAPPPLSRDDKATASYSTDFKVVHAVSSSAPGSMLDIVEPKGHTIFHNDSTISFHLSSVLAGNVLFTSASDEYDKLCMSYASQLLCEKRWRWAVFVLLCIIPPTSHEACRRRIECAKSIVLRYYDSSEGDVEENRIFLEQDVGIPTFWFSEALSNRSLTVVDYVAHTLSFDPPAALHLLETRYLPSVFFTSRTQVDKLMGMVEGMAAAQNSVASAVFRFFSLVEDVRRLKLRSDGDVPASLRKLFQEHSDLSRIFQSHASKIRTQSVDYRFYVDPPMRVSLSSMLGEALRKLNDIRLELAALRDAINCEALY